MSSPPDRIRVLWVIKGLGAGGAEHLLLSGAQAVDREAFDVEVAYALPHKTALVEPLRALGIPVHCIGGRGGMLGWARRLRALVRARRYDVVHVHSPLIAGLARPALAGLPHTPAMLTTEHVPWSTYAPATRLLNALTFALDAAHITVSEEVRSSIWRPLRATAEVVTHGIVAATPTPGTRERVRAELGIAPGDVVCITVANFRAQKAYPDLLRAAALVLQRAPRARFVIVGQGPLEAEVRAGAAALGERVHVLGQRDDVADLLAASDVFALASHYEGLPVALMEAMAAGLPTVATAVGGIAETITPGLDGSLVPPHHPEMLADALVAMADDATARARMGAAARATAVRFDIAATMRHIEAIYRSVAPVDVLSVISDTDRRGAQVFALDLEHALRARGRRVRTVALAPGARDDLDLPTLGDRPLRPATLRALRRAARRARVTIAHGSTTAPATTLAGIRAVYRNIGDPLWWANTRARRLRVGTALRRARAVVALTPANAAVARDVFGVQPERIRVIPNGAVPRAADPARAGAMRARLGIAPDAPVALFLGNLSDEKDPLTAIGAVGPLDGVHLLIAGDGPLADACRREGDRVAPGRVHLLGVVDPADALAASDVVVITSRSEGMPAAIIEAAFAGVPSVATAVGCIPDMIVDGKTGTLVSPGGDVSAAIATTLAARAEMGEAARERCARLYDMDVVAAAWDDLLADLGAWRRA